MTLVEVVVVVATMALLAGALLPAFPRGRVKGSGIQCVSNLKQLGLGFRMWAGDSEAGFPFHVSKGAAQPGTFEQGLTGEVWRHFAAISNEVNTPRVMVCPADRGRVALRTGDWGKFKGNEGLSYFLGLDASELVPESLLTGDRNLVVPVEPVTRVARLRGGTPVEWSPEIHVRRGNVGLGDGSVRQCDPAALRMQVQAALLSSGQPELRVALP